eukprot:scaffold32801_cov66-Phaeocystis_antarctica.AAC.2
MLALGATVPGLHAVCISLPVGAFEVGCVRIRACLARQRGRRALRAVRAGRARPAHQLARRGLEGAGLALETRAHACVGRDRAGAARRLPGATGWRKVAHVSLSALIGAGEAGGAGVCALSARQRRAGTLRAVRAGLAGNARLLALAGLVLAGGAFVAEGSARGGRNESGRATSTVGWVGAPSNRTGLPRSARLARRAAILTAVWVERASGARRERLPQARRSFCRTRATAWTVAALGRADVLAQLARRARQAACASLVRVVGSGCARNAACLHQTGDPDGKSVWIVVLPKWPAAHVYGQPVKFIGGKVNGDGGIHQPSGQWMTVPLPRSSILPDGHEDSDEATDTFRRVRNWTL